MLRPSTSLRPGGNAELRPKLTHGGPSSPHFVHSFCLFFWYVSKLNIDNWNDSRVIGSSDWGIAPEKEKKKKPAEDRWGCSRQLYFVALDGVIELCGNDANEHDLTFVRFIGWDGKVPQTQRNRLIDIGEHSRYDQKQFAAHHDTEIRIMIDLSYWSSFNRIRWRIKMKSSIIKNRSWEKKLA